jgi:acyl-CoA thioester hydrolase
MIEPLKIQVRFSDIDLMGHVNNAVYLNYFESARMHYLVYLFGMDWDWKKNGIILKQNLVEYHYPVFLGDEPKIQVFLTHIGTKSFTLAYELKVNEKVCTTGESVLVSFDFEANQTTEISDLGRKKLQLIQKP